MMERNSNMEIPHIVNSQMAEPHFDDERTIQTARPVVPLNMRHRFITKRRLMLSGAFVLAAVLGAGAALALVHSRQANTAISAESEETNQVQDSDATAQAAPPVEENQGTAANEEAESTEERPIPRQSTRTRPVIRHASPTIRRVSIPVSIESDDDAKALLVDEWQERRQRRVTRPLRRNEHHRSDLFRIRDIFEGPRRRPE